jgi:N-acetylglucosamine kinase-like BadF-type ATPase
MTKYYLGVDGGGSKTQAVIVDEEGQLCGIGMSEASNVGNTSVEQAQTAIERAVALAAQATGIAPSNFAAAFLGIAGVVSEADRETVRRIARHLRLASPAKTGVDHDCRIALAGGLAGQPGIVQIIGTGTACFGMNAEGKRWMAGGWGHLVADEGGGYWLGIQAIKAAAAAYDGRGDPTLLHDAVLEALEINSISQIMQRLYAAKISIADIARLSHVVVRAAERDDAVAQGIIGQGMDEIARCVEAVTRALRFGDATTLVCVGGMTRAGSIITEPLTAAVHRYLPNCRIETPRFSPAVGAALLARQHDYPAINSHFLQTLQTSLEGVATP